MVHSGSILWDKPTPPGTHRLRRRPIALPARVHRIETRVDADVTVRVMAAERARHRQTHMACVGR